MTADEPGQGPQGGRPGADVLSAGSAEPGVAASHGAAALEIVGRELEVGQLNHLLSGARNGRGSALLLLGEPGIGKTSLLAAAETAAVGLRVQQVEGYESESSMPYAGLYRLIMPLRDYLTQLSERHQQALEVAVGKVAGPVPDRYLVGLGLLELLAAAAGDGPLACFIDDAHLMDVESLEALAFVARRLYVEPIALIFAGRDEEGIAERLSGVPDLVLQGLPIEAAVSLLRSSTSEAIDPAVAVQIAHATGCNPLALIDLASTMASGELSNLSAQIDPTPIGHRLESHYAQSVRQEDEDVQEWMLVAAADSTGNIDLTTAAAESLGLPVATLDRAEAAGLIKVAGTVRFRHPLVRSAVYNSADGVRQRRIHAALAAAAAQLGLTELEAWHSARATLGTDTDVADRVERAADLAGGRGGFASRSSMLVKAAELTPAGAVRDSRSVAAAEAALIAGAAQMAATILDGIEGHAIDPVIQGRVLVLRAALAMFGADPPALLSAPATLFAAADLLEGRAPDLELRALLKAFEFTMVADRLVQGISLAQLGERLQRGAAQTEGPGAVVLEGLGALILLPYGEALPVVRAAFEEILRMPDHEMMHMGSILAALGTFLWDEAARSAALERAVVAARDAGALQVVDQMLWTMSLAELTGGSVKKAVRYTELVREVRRAMGYDAENVINASVMAWTGSPRHVVLAIADGANAVGFGGVGFAAVAAVGLRDIAEGNYRDAYDTLKPLIEEPFLQVTPTEYANFIEAATRIGRGDEVSDLAGLLSSLAEINGSLWCRGVAHRAAGLCASGAEAEKQYEESLVALTETQALVELARTHLVYGEWLRRAKRRAESSRHLLEAIRLFEATGAHMFVPRTRTELEATGAGKEAPTKPHRFELTTRELTIAQQAAAGQTNAEIGSNLFISPNTVDYHLRKVFQKLGVTSRRQLADKLADEDS
ncbi:helix-turn-helix transcriptional regulator [Pimelobacter simplex]|uniref:helix-turn-helix transcriptional regulator n=1 Tax=Nocardioides simplex TaxID=2045 RepID=UPI001931F8F2|nr:AAA family ATPase [Pimelobacter simplex]